MTTYLLTPEGLTFKKFKMIKIYFLAAAADAQTANASFLNSIISGFVYILFLTI